MKFETLAVHAGHRVDLETGAVTPPLHYLWTNRRRQLSLRVHLRSRGQSQQGSIGGPDTSPGL